MVYFSFTTLVIAGLAVTSILLIILYLAWNLRSTVIGRLAMGILAFGSLYSLIFSLSLGSADPAISLTLVLLELPFRVILPVLSFLFILLYIGEIEYVSARIIALTCGIPVVVLVAAVTNSLHFLFVSNISPVIVHGCVMYLITPGPLFWLDFTYSVALIIAGVSLAVSRFIHSPSIFRVQIAAVLAAFVVPFFMHLSLILMPATLTAILISLAAFVIQAIAVYVATSRFQFLTLSPVAFPVLFNRMTDGVLIVNTQGLVVGVNPAACRILGEDRGRLIGSPAGPLIPGVVFLGDGCQHDPGGPMTITLTFGGVPHYFDIQYIPLCGHDRHPGGGILLLPDSHTRHITELGLRKANEKLQLLTSITRHDIGNSLMAVMGLLEMARTERLPEKADEYLVKAGEYANRLQNQIEFTRDYQTLGLQSAQWQNVQNALMPCLQSEGGPHIHVDPILGETLVFADPMFGRVFYNLVENSIRHGSHVNEIRIGGRILEKGFIILYEDDGTGIPQDEKERIFEKGYGKNTGYGLFLAREILALTGITILENGREGEGARFELHVPEGAYRLVKAERFQEESSGNTA